MFFGPTGFKFEAFAKCLNKHLKPSRISFFFVWNLPPNKISNYSVMVQKRPIRNRSPHGREGFLNIDRPYKKCCGPNWDLSRPMHGQSDPISNAFRTTMVQVDLPNRISSSSGRAAPHKRILVFN